MWPPVAACDFHGRNGLGAKVVGEGQRKGVLGLGKKRGGAVDGGGGVL